MAMGTYKPGGLCEDVRLLVLGATGPLGRCVVAEAVRRGHFVRALVRSACVEGGLHVRERVEVTAA